MDGTQFVTGNQMSKKKTEVFIGFDERTGHEFYQEVTNPVKQELIKRGFNVETFDLRKTEAPRKKYDAIVLNYGTTVRPYPADIAILIEHGITPLKNAPGFMATHFFCAGKAYRFMLEKVNKHKGKFYTVGYPKIDDMVRQKENREIIKKRIIKELRLDSSKPIISYLPTYTPRKENYAKSGTVLELNKLNFDKEISNFVISVHGFDKEYKPVVDILKKAKYTYWKPNKQDLLIASDIIVGDISSIILESLVLDVPIIQIHKKDYYMYSMYNHHAREHGCYGLLQVGDACEIERLPEIIKRNLKYDENKWLRKYWLENLLHKPDGNTAKRVADLVEEVLKEEGVLE